MAFGSNTRSGGNRGGGDRSGAGARTGGSRSGGGNYRSESGNRSFSDRPAPRGDRPYGDKKPYGDRPSGDRKPYGEQRTFGDKKPYGDRPTGDRKPYGERSFGDKKPYGERSFGDKKPYGDRPVGDRKPYGEQRTFGDKKPYGDRPVGDKKPYGEQRTFGDRKPYSDRPVGDRKPYGERSFGDKKPYGERSFGDKKPYGDRPVGDRKPYGERSFGDKKPYGERSFGDKKPYGEKKSYGKPYEKPAYDRKEAYVPVTPVVEEPIVPNEADSETLPQIIFGRNTVREAIKSDRSIDRIFVVNTGSEDGSLREIVGMAREQNIIISQVDKAKLDAMCMPFGHAGKPANHQGIVAQMPECQYATIEEILESAKAKNEPPFVLVLDSISDPHNLGSIIRSAECAGVHGVVIPKRRAASVTAAVAKASAGATMYVPIARVANLTQAVETLKKEGLWIAGADMDGTPMQEVNLKGPLALVIGGEDEGISRLLREACDHIVSIPLAGKISSLNASVSAAILMYEKRRQDGK